MQNAYCGVCGQRAVNRIVPLWQVSNEFLEDLFDLDLRILRTFPTFFFRPGHLTVEYVRGRRRRYIRPLRLYLFSSFLLFTVLALTNVGGFSFTVWPSPDVVQAEVAAAQAELEAVRAELGLQDASNGRPEENDGRDAHSAEELPIDSGGEEAPRQQVAVSIEEGLQGLDEALAAMGPMHAASENETMPAGSAPSLVGSVDALTQGQIPLKPKLARILHDPSALVNDLIDRAPYLMFLLVPTFALLLKGLYFRRHRLYLEHLVFSLHVHALAFIAFAVSAGIGALEIGTALHLDGWVAVAPFGYLFVAMRRMYGQSRAVTAAKATALLLAYGIILVGAVVGLVLVTVALT